MGTRSGLEFFAGNLAIFLEESARWTYKRNEKLVDENVSAGDIVLILGCGEPECFRILTSQGRVFDVRSNYFGPVSLGDTRQRKWFEIL